MSEQPLDLVLDFSEGVGEIIADINHPIVAAFRRGMEEGQLTGSWHYLIVKDSQNNKNYIIGTFVRTPNDRILFFPGSNIFIEADDPTAHFNGRRLDHITADPPKESKISSHIAVQDLPHNKSRGLHHRSKPPMGYMWPWFSFLVSNLSKFSQLPRRLTLRFPRPPGDMSDFGKRLLPDGGYDKVTLPSVRDRVNSYIQLDIWLCHEPDCTTSLVRPLAWPYINKIVKGAPPDGQQLNIHRVDISIAPDIVIVVLISRSLGNLLGDRILRPTLSR